MGENPNRGGRRFRFFAPGLKRYETSEFRTQSPEAFVPISLTGAVCQLGCDHCEGKLLQFMRSVSGGGLFPLCSSLAERGTQGVLLSGGSDSQGKVPLVPYLDEIKRVKKELSLRVIVHTGLVEEELAAGLKEAGIDAALLDVIGAEATIREVCHLSTIPQAYERSLYFLTKHGVTTVPHIVLGLHYGMLLGEGVALEMVCRYPISALVLVVLSPLVGTAMEGVSPPALGEIACFFEKARKALAHIPILLGCARPAGEEKKAIERLALDLGLDGMAYPSQGTVRYARRKGLIPEFSESCCALLALEDYQREVKDADLALSCR